MKLLLLLILLPWLFAACGREPDITNIDTEASGAVISDAVISDAAASDASTAMDAPVSEGHPEPEDTPSTNVATDTAASPWQFPSLHLGNVLGHTIQRREWLRDITISMESNVPAYNFQDARGRIRGRGNSTWGLDKRPYRIRFNSSHARAMLDAGHVARDWTLIANHSDPSFMRHYSAYYFSGLLGTMDFSPFARFVHLYFDGRYRGVYMLSDQVEAGPGRAELTFDQDPALSEYLIHFNMRAHYNNAVEGLDFVRVNNLLYEFRFPTGDQMPRRHAEYARQFINIVDRHIMNRSDEVFNYIDLASFVDYYILMELYKDQDAGRFSQFMQIRGQGDQRRLEMGPVWDFDIAVGNAYYQGQPDHSLDGIAIESGYRPDGVWMALENRWFRMLMLNPTFFAAVVDRWQEVREDQFPALIDHINFMAHTYQADFERNFDVWPILGRSVWPNPRRVARIDTFLGHVEYVTDFLETRAAWLDTNLWTHDQWGWWEQYAEEVIAHIASRNRR
ncbi:MAG: CotH kinase family protein [Defluviitaleaceae bacterium]|nr:CotH kinase family protein [Defluviitaleaceae bacterium]